MKTLLLLILLVLVVIPVLTVACWMIEFSET